MRKFRRITMVAAVVLLFSVTMLFAWLPGRMTGGGSVITDSGVRVTHGFELHCGPEPGTGPIPGPNNLEINWDSGNHWHLDTLTLADCSSDGFSPAPPPNTASGFDVYHGAGTGTCNGVPGVYAEWVFTDHGEPGKDDTATYYIVPSGACPGLAVGVKLLTFGNHQAHDN
jgi:hypothetical protein